MSNLKHLSLDELNKAERSCEKHIHDMYAEIRQIERTIKPFTDKIESLSQRIGGQQTRLEWIRKYQKNKTHVQMTMSQIEAMLGQKIIIVDE